MDSLKRARRPHRTEATRLVTELAALLEAPDQEKDKRKIRTKFKLLLETKDKLMDLDEKILNQHVADQTDEKVEEDETKGIREYREKIENIIDHCEEVLQSCRPRSPTPSDSASNTDKKRNFKLPEIELKRYNGDLKEWLGFWSQFEKIHDDDSLHDSDKFQYLLQAMEKGSPARELVESYPQSGENYAKAVAALRDRFGDKDLLLQVYVRELLKLVVTNVTSPERIPLSKLYMKLDSHLRSLQTLELATADPATWLFPLVESSLDADTLRAWQRSPQIKTRVMEDDDNPGEERKTRLDLLMEFLKTEVQIEQRIQVVQTGFQQNTPEFKRPHDKPVKLHKGKNREREENLPTAAGLLSATGKEVTCVFCDGNHDSKACVKAKGMSMEEKQAKIKQKGACFACLRIGHQKKKCRAHVSCHLCPKKHVTIMCPLLHQTWSSQVGTPTGSQVSSGSNGGDKGQTQPKQQAGLQTTVQASNVSCIRDIILMTLRVKVSVGKGWVSYILRLLIDGASQRSCIRTRAVELLGSRPISTEISRNLLFDGSVTKYAETNIHRVTISGLDGKHSVELELREKPKIGGGIPIVPEGPWMETLKGKGIEISDFQSYGDVNMEEIDIVIGKDNYWLIMTSNEMKLTPHLGAKETIFGWTLSGKLPQPESYGEVSIQMLQTEEECTRLWSMEVLGIKEPISKLTKAEEESAALEIFKETTTRLENGRYKVELPWVNGPQALPTNRKVAEQRLHSTTRKLEKMGLLEHYGSIFRDWLAEDFIEEVEDPQHLEVVSKCHYVCHHPVFKDSPTTPTRPVFDASCKVGRYPSLNDCLFKGPNFIEFLPAVIMRFREKILGVVADIRKAFQMIEVAEVHRNFLRFLWWEQSSQKIKVFRHKRVVFGVNCSPFLLAAVLELHLSSETDRVDIAKKLSSSMYVDNVVSSVDSLEEYQDFRDTAVNIMKNAQMELRQWEMTRRNIDQSGAEAHELEPSNLDSVTTKVLGMVWNKVEDTLSVYLPDQMKITFSKRGILSIVSKIFDPIGFTCPAVFSAKVLFQRAWKLKTDWDEELVGELRDEFDKWTKELRFLQDIAVPRHHQLYQPENVELHLFCDGSLLGYAAAVFLRTQVGDHVEVQLIQAKARLAPQEKATIPRLELCACLIGARLIHSVKEALNMHQVPTHLWSDSTTAIAWIRKNDDWGTFVGNRVRQILEVTKSEDWRHVAGINNPADLPSRGCSPSELLQSRWWEGPAWLHNGDYPISGETCDEELVNSERKKTAAGMMEGTCDGWFVPKFSSYIKNVKVLGWIKRVINNGNHEVETIKDKYLTICEIRKAELALIKIIQEEFYGGEPKITSLVVVKGEDGIFRVKTALTLKKDDTASFRWPILIPGKHPIAEQLIREAHLIYGHVGTQALMGILRERYWITRTRKTVARVIGKCITCQRYNVKAVVVEPAPLPYRRVQTGEAFTTVGVDLAGPLFIKDKRKVWIVLYTCAVYRCVWLDLVLSLDTASFIMSLQRFIGMHGRPSTIYSDNGTNFVGANNLFKTMKWVEIEKESEAKQIRWIFNPPTASWWGGFWERLVKSVKGLLRRMLGRSKLDFEQLRTCLAAVTSAINERPLTTITEDPNDFMPLTPAMFIKGTRGSTFPEGQTITQTDFRKQYAKMIRMMESLVARFRKEYLSLLVRKPVAKSWQAKVGQLVLVGVDNKKRYNWSLGRVVELIPGRDGIIRLLKVRTATGIHNRPAQRIYPLEVPEVSDESILKVDKSVKVEKATVGPETQDVARSRFGRKLNKPIHYDSWKF